MSWVKSLIKELFSALGFYLAGAERHKRKQSEAARDLQNQMAEIAAGPDISRNELNRRMRERATSDGSVSSISGPEPGRD